MAISPTDIRIIFTNYDNMPYFLNLASCSEHFISIKHRILATFNIRKKINSDGLYAFNGISSIKSGLFNIILLYKLFLREWLAVPFKKKWYSSPISFKLRNEMKLSVRIFSASNKYLPRLLSSLVLRTDSNCTNLKHDGICQ
jgi:hypothetical protein